jgi:hypothetical protein
MFGKLERENPQLQTDSLTALLIATNQQYDEIKTFEGRESQF